MIGLALWPAAAPAQEPDPSSPLGSLVQAERAFARHSAEKGMASAFMAFLSDEAVVFRPHPVNGQEWFRSHPAPPVRLAWAPGFADISATGEMGYTTGPWTARDESDSTAPPAYGEFVTVWKKHEGNVWKVEIDLGISHPAPVSDVQFTAPKHTPVAPALIRPDSGFLAMEKSRLLAREREAFGDSAHVVPVERLLSTLGSGARVLRPGRFPLVDTDSSAQYFASHAGESSRRTQGSDLSHGGDLGYTYGTFRFLGKDAQDQMAGYFLTIWKKDGKREWKVVLDLQTAPLQQR